MFQIQLQDAKPGEEVAWADGLTIYFGLRYGMGLESGCWILGVKYRLPFRGRYAMELRPSHRPRNGRR